MLRPAIFFNVIFIFIFMQAIPRGTGARTGGFSVATVNRWHTQTLTPLWSNHTSVVEYRFEQSEGLMLCRFKFLFSFLKPCCTKFTYLTVHVTSFTGFTRKSES